MWERERECFEEYLDAGYYDLAINRLNSLSLVSFLSVEPRTVRYYFRKLMKRIANKREIKGVTRSSKILEQKVDEITRIATEPIRWYCFIKTDDLIVNLFIGILNAFRGITADEIKRAESSDILHSEYFRAKVEAAIERVPILFESNPLYVSPIEAAIADELISEFRNPNMRPWEIIAELSLLPNAFRKSPFYRGVRITAVDQIVERWHYPRSWTKSVINKTKTLLMVDNSLLNL